MRKVLKFLDRRRRAYQDIFSGKSGQIVLKDLARYCRANSTAFTGDERETNFRLGRQDVWLRIQSALHLTDEDIASLSRSDDE